MLGDIRPQAALPGIRQLLRGAKAYIREVAVAISSKRPWTADREVLHHYLSLGQGRSLRRSVAGGVNCPLGNLDRGIVLSRFRDQSLQTYGGALRPHGLSQQKNDPQVSYLRHVSSHAYREMKSNEDAPTRPRNSHATKKKVRFSG